MKNNFKAMVLSCIDPRFQSIVHNYLNNRGLKNKYSCFTIAGGGIGISEKQFSKWHDTFYDNLDVSIKLHNIKKLIVINHQDCGAAKIANNNKELDIIYEKKFHIRSFRKLKKKLIKKFPKIKLEFILIYLNKTVIKFNV
tara:strand:+ start:322 stop:741 length:420 start_codon:yes stop_codon:yes gene_type:complete